MSRALLLALLAALLLAPPAQAHVEGFSQAKTVAVGPYTVFLAPQPDVIFANTTLSMTAQIAFNDTGGAARGVGATLLVAGPEGFSKRIEMRSDGSSHLGAVLLPHRGIYSARILLRDATDNYSADVELEAYPDLPVRIRAADAMADTYVGEQATLVFETVNRTTQQPVDALADLSIVIERWSDDHSQMLGTENATLTKEDGGRWRLAHVFKERGMYHLKFASQAGGFTYADVPILHTYATMRPDAVDDGSGGRSVPALGLLPLAVALGLVALAAARRR